MSANSPKTTEQLRAIFGLARSRGVEMDDDAKAGLAATASLGRVDRLSLLSFDEANRLIEHLGGEALPVSPGVPRRTQNYHRQQAGITQIAQPRHLDKMLALAASRNMSTEGLQALGYRMLRHWPPRTTAETNKIIEALKAMIARDRAKGSSIPDPKSPIKKEAA